MMGLLLIMPVKWVRGLTRTSQSYGHLGLPTSILVISFCGGALSIYQIPLDTVEQLRNRVEEVAKNIRANPDMILRTQ